MNIDIFYFMFGFTSKDRALLFISLFLLIAPIEHNTGKLTSPRAPTSKQANIDPKSSDKAQSTTSSSAKNNTKNWLFKDYMKKYRPINVWERLHRKRKAQGLNVSLEKDFDDLFNAMDETDDLLSIQVQPPQSGRRKWFPPGKLQNEVAQGKDQFSLRRRIYELMLHAIYWTRNKLIVMQDYRKKYSHSKLYKMGYMMSKADIACKMFHRFAYRALHACLGVSYYHLDRFYPIEILHAEERLNYKWFDIELLIDLITQNDDSCKSMLEKVDENRLTAWTFVD